MRPRDSHAIASPSRNKPLPSLEPRKSGRTRRHQVEFYPDDEAFVVGFADFIEAALKVGSSVIVVATPSHRESLIQRLQGRGVDIVAAIERECCVSLDVAEILSTFMKNDLPDPMRFFKVAEDLITTAPRRWPAPTRVSLCGECAPILWTQGKTDAAVRVEQLCNQLTKRYDIDILCGFLLNSFYREEDKRIFEKIHIEP